MYTALGKVYDLFYENDAGKRADVYARYLPLGEGVDLGCGTGALTLELYKRGYRIAGADVSSEMLAQAAERALRAGARIRFTRGSAYDPLSAHPLDFVLAANDVCNYVPRLDKAFSNICGALRAGGVFAFDISSAYKLTQILAGNTFSETKENVTYVWQNCRKGNKLLIDFTVFTPEGELYRKSDETQTQYIRTEQEIADALAKAGFTDVRAYAFGKKDPPAQDAPRILFTARKP